MVSIVLDEHLDHELIGADRVGEIPFMIPKPNNIELTEEFKAFYDDSCVAITGYKSDILYLHQVKLMQRALDVIQTGTDEHYANKSFPRRRFKKTTTLLIIAHALQKQGKRVCLVVVTKEGARRLIEECPSLKDVIRPVMANPRGCMFDYLLMDEVCFMDERKYMDYVVASKSVMAISTSK